MKNKILIALLFITLSMTPKTKAINSEKIAAAIGLTYVAFQATKHLVKSVIYLTDFADRQTQSDKITCTAGYFAPRFIADYCAYKFFRAAFR